MTKMTDAQRAYESKRAAKAGLSLDKWLHDKAKQKAPPPAAKPKPAGKPGLLSRLLDRAHKPIGKKS